MNRQTYDQPGHALDPHQTEPPGATAGPDGSVAPSAHQAPTPPVQILLATYNASAWIEPLLDSLLTQTYPYIAVLARDNASTDDTFARLERAAARHPSRVRILRHDEPNLGALGNFARLLDLADAPYVMFADADDVWLPDKAAVTLSWMLALEKQFSPSTPLLVHTDLTVVDAELHEVSPSAWRAANLDPRHSRDPRRLLTQNCAWGCTMMLNRPLVDLARPVPTDVVMHDWWIALVAASLGHVGYVTRPTILHRQHGGNDTGVKSWGPRHVLAQARRVTDRRRFNQRMAPTLAQAEHLLRRFEGRLAPDIAAAVGAYAELPNVSPPRRWARVVRHGLWQRGMVRNLGWLWAVGRMPRGHA
ncbi:MAG: glycosyltransferase [Phycisphaeraceae bacterium]|nr:glycosyltransferase [Phycisphaeraceae bacterium]